MLHHRETPESSTSCTAKSERGHHATYSPKAWQVGYSVTTGSSPSLFVLYSKVASWLWLQQAHSEVGHPESADTAGAKLACTCARPTFFSFCTHLCFLPRLDLPSLCEAEESCLSWWSCRVLASPLEGVC